MNETGCQGNDRKSNRSEVHSLDVLGAVRHYEVLRNASSTLPILLGVASWQPPDCAVFLRS